MATLVSCRACGKEVAKSAGKCPHCGVAQPGLSAGFIKWAKRFVIGSMLFLFGTCVLVLASAPDKNANTATPDAAAPAEPPDGAILKTFCQTVAKEDQDNGGIRADGSPWDLTDLTTDASLEYSLTKYNPTNLPRAGRVLMATLQNRPANQTIDQMCGEVASPIATNNASARETIADAIASLRKSIRLDMP